MTEQSIFEKLFSFFQDSAEKNTIILNESEQHNVLQFKQNHSDFLIKHNLFILNYVYSKEPNCVFYNSIILDLLGIKISPHNMWNDLLFPILYKKLETNEHLFFIKHYSWQYANYLNPILLQKLYDSPFYSMLNKQEINKMFLCLFNKANYSECDTEYLKEICLILKLPYLHENDKKYLMSTYLKSNFHYVYLKDDNLRTIFVHEMFKPYLTPYLKNHLLAIKCKPFNTPINLEDINYLIEQGAQIISPKTNCVVSLIHLGFIKKKSFMKNLALIENDISEIDLIENLLFGWFQNKNIVVSSKTLKQIDKIELLEKKLQNNTDVTLYASQYLLGLWNKFLLSEKLNTNLIIRRTNGQQHKL